MTINLKNKQKIIAKFGQNDKDSGSARVQVALLTQKILELTEHLKQNKKDFQGRRGLLKMVGRRKQFLSYIKNKNIDEYRQLIADLNIRG